MTDLASLIRSGFSKRQGSALLEALSGAGGGGGGGGGSFGGVRHARNTEHDLTGTTSQWFRPKTWAFDNPFSDAGTPAFELAVADDDPHAFGTTVAGWYTIRYSVAARFVTAPPEVVLQATGYNGDVVNASFACSAGGGDLGFYAGVQIDLSQGPTWLPALGDNGDNSGYIFASLRWADTVQRDIELFGIDTVPIDFYVGLIAAT